MMISSENNIPSNVMSCVVPFSLVNTLSVNENESDCVDEWFCGIPDDMVVPLITKISFNVMLR